MIGRGYKVEVHHRVVMIGRGYKGMMGRGYKVEGLTCAHEDLVEAGVPVHSHHAAHRANAPHQLRPASKPHKSQTQHTHVCISRLH